MGRQVRRVPADWEHPKNAEGYDIPLHDGFDKAVATWEEGCAMWERGLRRSNASGTEEFVPRTGDEITFITYEDWSGERPKQERYMPDWPESQRTHWQMYENTSEGTPISPVCASAEDLATWLADNVANAGAGRTGSYDQWLRTIHEGWSPTFVITNGVLRSGVEDAP